MMSYFVSRSEPARDNSIYSNSNDIYVSISPVLIPRDLFLIVVDDLVTNTDLQVVVYTGQLDVIADILGKVIVQYI